MMSVETRAERRMTTVCVGMLVVNVPCMKVVVIVLGTIGCRFQILHITRFALKMLYVPPMVPRRYSCLCTYMAPAEIAVPLMSFTTLLLTILEWAWIAVRVLWVILSELLLFLWNLSLLILWQLLLWTLNVIARCLWLLLQCYYLMGHIVHLLATLWMSDLHEHVLLEMLP